MNYGVHFTQKGPLNQVWYAVEKSYEQERTTPSPAAVYCSCTGERSEVIPSLSLTSLLSSFFFLVVFVMLIGQGVAKVADKDWWLGWFWMTYMGWRWWKRSKLIGMKLFQVLLLLQFFHLFRYWGLNLAPEKLMDLSPSAENIEIFAHSSESCMFEPKCRRDPM